MATGYTSLLGLALPVQGELPGQWGDTVNNSITSLLDTAVAGATTVSADTTLTSTNLVANQARSAILIASGHVANITITAPARSKTYAIINTSGTYTVKIVGSGPTTGVTLAASEKALVAWNGSDFVKIASSAISNLTGVVSAANGGTGVANNAASTLTITGAYGTTFTVSGTTALTLPTSGTLVTLAGTETLTNKTLTSPTLTTPALGTPASGNFSSGTFTWPTFNQNTTGSAASLSANLPVSRLNSGTGASSSTYWRGDGTWSTVTASAAGSDTQIQYNSSGSLAGSANFTYNGTTIVSGANASTVGNLTGSFKSGRLLGTLTVAPTGGSSPPSGFNYYMGYLGTTPIGLSDANRVLKIATIVNSTVSETYGQVAYGTTYGSKNAGMAFVSGTTNDALKVAINVAPLYTSDVNAVLLGYTVNGPRILIQNYALYDDSANVITSIADGHVWSGLTGGLQLSRTTGAFTPDTDNAQNLGGSSTRWAVVYAGTGTINTSDRNDKQDIEELSAAEQRVAVRVKGLIRKFRFKESVAAKGDNARVHFGVIAQDVQDAFTAEGLDASRYGLFCSDTFKAVNGKPVKKDPLTQEYPEGTVDYTRFGVRYDELLAFVISAV